MKTKSLRYLTSALIISSCICSYSFAGSDNDERSERRGPPQFSEFDLDNDGEITLEEFIEHKPPGSAEEIFSHIDADGDGVITESELSNHKPPRRNRD